MSHTSRRPSARYCALTFGDGREQSRAKGRPLGSDDFFGEIGALHDQLGLVFFDVPNLARPVGGRGQEHVGAKGVAAELVRPTLYTAPVWP